MVYDLSDRAKRALVELHEEYQRKASDRTIIKPPGFYGKLAAEYEQKVQDIIRGSFTEVDADRTVRVRCPNCGREGAIRASQARWACSCSTEDHHTFATIVEVP